MPEVSLRPLRLVRDVSLGSIVGGPEEGPVSKDASEEGCDDVINDDPTGTKAKKLFCITEGAINYIKILGNEQHIEWVHSSNSS